MSKLILFPFFIMLISGFGLGIIFTVSRANAALPGQRWGQQIEVGTVGNSNVIKVVDEGLSCLVVAPRNGSTPAVTCWGSM